jgi:hypothetical protein
MLPVSHAGGPIFLEERRLRLPKLNMAHPGGRAVAQAAPTPTRGAPAVGTRTTAQKLKEAGSGARSSAYSKD